MQRLRPAADQSPTDELLFALTLPAVPASVAIARHALGGISAYLADDTLDTLQLLTSEAVTNAIRHGSLGQHDVVEVDVTLARGELVVRVTDAGPEFELPAERPAPGQLGGFGLFIIADLARWLRIERTDVGNVVTFAL